MLNDFLSYINKHKLCTLTDSVLVAVSGGKDSMALLHLFQTAKFTIKVAHCNFQLRGKESDLDEEFVKQYCLENKVDCFIKKFETKEYAQSHKVSIEMAARDLRYSWFRELSLVQNCTIIATGHHLNDTIETLFLNFTKGLGPNGLKGIPFKSDTIIRPLLFADSFQISQYLSSNNLKWREDFSNQENEFQRNKIRNQVIPTLKEINPGLEKTMAVNLHRFYDLAEIFNETLKQFVKEAVFEEENQWVIKPQKWLNSKGFHLILEEFLKPFGFNYQQVTDLLAIKESGKQMLSQSHTIQVGREKWYLKSLVSNHGEKDFSFEAIGTYLIDNKEWKLELFEKIPSQEELKNKNTCYVPFDKVIWPLKLRKWKEGDSFFPFGMKGKKKVSDLLIDLKLEPIEKQNQQILADQNDIIWVVGLRSSEKFRIDKSCLKFLKIEFV